MADNQNKLTSALQRNASEVKTYRSIMRVGPILAGCLTLGLVLIYIVAVLYGRYGSFTVSVNKYDNLTYALSLSETKDFANPTIRLDCKASENVYNIDGSTLPEYLDEVDGEHNGTNYVAYTFYCKNSGEETVNYEYRLVVSNATSGIERACRVRLYVNGVPTDYAFTATDGSGPEPGTVPFYQANIITRAEIKDFAPNDVTKFTCVIWLEGNDPDCVDSVIGGTLRVDMHCSILGIDDDTNN